MRQRTGFPELRAQAITLRRAGKSRREIAELLEITSHSILNEALKGEPPPPWTLRPNARDDLRAKARDLRAGGHSYNAIVAQLGVAKSTVSAWVSDMPRPQGLSYEQCRKRAADGVRRYWEAERLLREAERNAARAAAAAQIGELNCREVLIAGAIAYWCEGMKNKPYRRDDRVVFTNSDPALIRLFLRFLLTAGITRERLIYQVQIHESADVEAAQRFWLNVTQAPSAQFRRPTLKRHNPVTVRKNIGDTYRGCLRVEVRRGAALYWQIEGWATAATLATSRDRQRTGIRLPGEDSNLGRRDQNP